jgi:MshEN domain
MEPRELLSDLRPREARKERRSFGAVAVDEGVVTVERLREALAEGARTGERPGEVIIRRGWADEGQIGWVLSEQWQLPFLRSVPVVAEFVCALLPLEEARRLQAYPISFEEGVAVVAVADPGEERFDAVRDQLDIEVRFVIVPRGELNTLLEGRIAAEPLAAEQPPGPAKRSVADPTDAALPDDAGVLIRELEVLTDTLATSSEHLSGLQSALDILGEHLARTRDEHARCQHQLTLAEAERDQHGATIRALEEQLRERARRAQELKTKLLHLINGPESNPEP